MKSDSGYGEAGGSRAGRPVAPQRNNKGKGSLGAGKESTGGVAKEGDGKVDERRSATVTQGKKQAAPKQNPRKGSAETG